jgi:hypothetical protein
LVPLFGSFPAKCARSNCLTPGVHSTESTTLRLSAEISPSRNETCTHTSSNRENTPLQGGRVTVASRSHRAPFSRQFPTIQELIGSINTSAFIGTDSHNLLDAAVSVGGSQGTFNDLGEHGRHCNGMVDNAIVHRDVYCEAFLPGVRRRLDAVKRPFNSSR